MQKYYFYVVRVKFFGRLVWTIKKYFPHQFKPKNAVGPFWTALEGWKFAKHWNKEGVLI